MDGTEFDRVVKLLATMGARRQALRGVAGALAVAIVPLAAEAGPKKKKKKRRKQQPQEPEPPESGVQCRELTEFCGENAPCCATGSAGVACRAPIKDECKEGLAGNTCCGLEGAACGTIFGNDSCRCCDDLVCAAGTDLLFRCQASEP